MINYLRSVHNPAWYHGHGKRAPYFEGWYFKLVTAKQDKRFAFIPGVFINQDPSKTHAFVQVLDGNEGKTYYHRFGSFEAKPQAFDVRIDRSYFKQDHIVIDIDDEVGRIKGELRFEGIRPWPVSFASPGVMGWFGWLPFLECYHGVLGMDHRIVGTIDIYGDVIDFTDGRGYIEKDWGKSFPSGYIWQQSNHFGQEGTSLSGSIAVIPNLGRSFAGFIVGFLHEDELYSFTTYNGSKVDLLRVDDHEVLWRLYNKNHELTMRSTRAESGPLLGPERSDMHKRVDETMKATIEVELVALDSYRKRTLYTGTGQNAGLEVVGDLRQLLTS